MTDPARATVPAKGSRPGREDELRTHRVFVRVNAVELAELERRKTLTGTREMGAYVRAALFAQEPPQAVVPELNRMAWLRLAEHLARMQVLAERLEELAAQPRSGLTGLVGRSRLEDVVSACLEELHAQGLKIQAVRRSLVASDRGHR